MSDQMTFWDLPNAISLQESADGPLPCSSQDGPQISPSGRVPLPVSRSALQESERGEMIRDTSPPILSNWSGMPAPQCCLANRSPARRCSEKLQEHLNEALPGRLHGLGSTIYSIVWKQHITPQGRTISRQRASARRTSASGHFSGPTICDLPQVGWNTARATDGSNGGPNQKGGALPADAALTGWATASARDWKDTGGMAPTGQNPDGSERNRMDQLGRQVHLAGWPTTTATDAVKQGNVSPRPGMMGLSETAPLAGWLTAQAGTPAQNGNNAAGNTDSSRRTVALLTSGTAEDRNLQTTTGHQPCRLTTSGEMLTGCSAGMESGGQLNPEHSRWLMGYPAAWGCCGDMAMQSVRQRRRRSSKPSQPSTQNSLPALSQK